MTVSTQADPTGAAAGPDRTEPRRVLGTRWFVVVASVGAGVAVALQIGKVPGALPALSAELGLSLTLGGWVLSAFYIAGAVGGLAIGAGIDRIGHRRGVLAGLTVTAACSGLGALANDAPVMLATRLGEGLGFTLTALAVPSLLVRATDTRRRGMVFGIWSSFIPAGTALAILATPWLLGPVGWRGLWLSAASLTAVSGLALAVATRTLPRETGQDASRVLTALRAVSTSPAPLLLAGVFAAYAAQFLAVFGFLPTLLTEHYQVGADTAAVLTAAAVACNIPGNILGGTLRGRGVARWSLICTASAIMAVAAVGIYATVLPIGLRFGACIVFSLAGGVIPATVIGAAPEIAPTPHTVAATVGVLTQGSTLGQTLGPPAIASLATAAGGWQASSALLGVAAAIAACLSITLRNIERRQHSTASGNNGHPGVRSAITHVSHHRSPVP